MANTTKGSLTVMEDVLADCYDSDVEDTGVRVLNSVGIMNAAAELMKHTYNSVGLCSLEVAIARGGLMLKNPDECGFRHPNYAGALSFPMQHEGLVVFDKDSILKLLARHVIPTLDSHYVFSTLDKFLTPQHYATVFESLFFDEPADNWWKWEVVVKPTRIDKPFVPQRICAADGIGELKRRLVDELSYCGHTPIIVSCYQEDIECEIRLWVVDGKVVTYSAYNEGKYGADRLSKTNLDKAMALAAEVAKVRLPFGDTYCLDVAIAIGCAVVVEINPMATSCLYNADLKKLASALVTYVEKRQKLFETLPYKGELRRHYEQAKWREPFEIRAATACVAMLKEHGDLLPYSILDIYDIFCTWDAEDKHRETK